MAASNALGEKLPMFVIGKSAKPRCFKHVRNLPCRYRSQKKAWMDGTLFEEWLRELDRKFDMQGRKIVLVVDNCPAHPDVSGLKAINLQFLPPNTTSCTQPMDQGVIRYVSFYDFLSSSDCYPSGHRGFRRRFKDVFSMQLRLKDVFKTSSKPPVPAGIVSNVLICNRSSSKFFQNKTVL